MIRPSLALAESCGRSFYFVADYHALNSLKDRTRLRELSHVEIARDLAGSFNDVFGATWSCPQP